MILDTYYVAVWCVENFLERLKVEKTPQKQGVAHGKWPVDPAKYGVSNHKNDLIRAFMVAESFLRVVWTRRLFSEIDMILNNSPSTYIDVLRCVENFLQPLEVEHLHHKNFTF